MRDQLIAQLEQTQNQVTEQLSEVTARSTELIQRFEASVAKIGEAARFDIHTPERPVQRDSHQGWLADDSWTYASPTCAARPAASSPEHPGAQSYQAPMVQAVAAQAQAPVARMQPPQSMFKGLGKRQHS